MKLQKSLRNFYRGNKTIRFYKLLLSYLLVILTLLVVVYPLIMNGYIQTMQKEEENRRKAMLETTGIQIDQHFSEMNSLAARISNNVLLSNAALRSGVSSQIDGIRELKNYVLLNSFLSDIFLFSFGEDGRDTMIFSSQYKYSVTEFFSIYQLSNWSLQTIEEMRHQNLFGRVLPLGQCTPLSMEGTFQGASEGYLYFFYSLPMGAMQPKALASFWVSEKRLQTIAQAALSSSPGKFEIVSGNTVYYSYEQREGEGWQWEDENVFHAEAESHLAHWKYRLSFPAAQITGKLVQTQSRMLLTVLLLFIIGIFLSFFLANRHYKPLRNVASKLRVPDGTDEIQVLSSGVDSILQSNQELTDRLNRQNERIQHDGLTALLLGIDEGDALFDDSPITRCGVVLLSIDDAESWHRQFSPTQRQMIGKSLCEMMELQAQEYGNGYAVLMPEGTAAALAVDVDREDDLPRLGDSIRQAFESYYLFSATIGVSQVSNNPRDLHLRYLEARAAVQQRFSLGGGQMILYREIKGTQGVPIAYTPEREHALASLVRQGRTEEARDAVLSVLNLLKESRASAEEMLLCTIGILNTLIRVQKELGLDADAQQMQMIRILRSEQAITFEQAREWLCRLTESMCADVNGYKNSARNERLDCILKLIDTRYQDPAFCLNDVASALGLSASYTTSFFKECTGETLMSYVDSLRMQHATLLLETTHLPIRDIVAQVGYTDQTNFIRKFKAAKGVTPAVYRQQFPENT